MAQTTYQWDLLPQPVEKPGNPKAYQIKADTIINALKTNRDIAYENSQNVLNANLEWKELEAKEEEINTRAINNALKLNEDRDLRELQLTVKAGQELALFGAQKYNEAQVKAGSRKWHNLPAEQKAQAVHQHDQIREYARKNQLSYDKVKRKFIEDDPEGFKVIEQLFDGLQSPGIAEMQRQMVLGGLNKADKLYNQIINEKTFDADTSWRVRDEGKYPQAAASNARYKEYHGKTFEYLQSINTPEAKGIIQDWEIEAAHQVRENFTFIGGQRIAKDEVIDKYVTPIISKVQKAYDINRAQIHADNRQAEEAERHSAAIDNMLNIPTEGGRVQEFSELVESWSAREGVSNGVARREIMGALSSTVKNLPYPEGAAKVERFLNDQLVDGNGQKWYVNEKMNKVIRQSGILEAIQLKKYNHARRQKAIESAQIITAQQSVRGVAQAKYNGVFPSAEVAEQEVSKIMTTMFPNNQLTPDKFAETYATLLNTAPTASGQDIQEQFLEQTTKLHGHTISMQEAESKGFAPELIEMLVKSGHVAKGETQFTEEQMKAMPTTILNGVTEAMKASGPLPDLDTVKTKAKIAARINFLHKQNMQSKAEGGLGLNYSNAYDKAITQVEQELLNPKSAEGQAMLIHKEPGVNLVQDGNTANLAAAKYFRANPKGTIDGAIESGAFNSLEPHVESIRKMIIDKGYPVSSIRAAIRGNEAFVNAVKDLPIYSHQLVDRLLRAKDPEGKAGLPKDFYDDQTRIRHRQLLNQEPRTEGTVVTTNAMSQAGLEEQDNVLKSFLPETYLDDKVAKKNHGNKLSTLIAKRFPFTQNLNIPWISPNYVSEVTTRLEGKGFRSGLDSLFFAVSGGRPLTKSAYDKAANKLRQEGVPEAQIEKRRNFEI